MNKKLTGGIALAASVGGAALALLASRALASGVPAADALTYSGYLEDKDGNPVTASSKVDVRLWRTATGTTPAALCTTSSPTTGIQKGRFSVTLDTTCTAAVKANPDVWVEVSVDDVALNRTKLGMVPYAAEAGHATAADSAAVGVAMRTTSVALRASCTNTTSGPSTYTDCVCRAGEVPVGGGAFANNGQVMRESRPVTEDATVKWRVACSNTNGSDVLCVTPTVVCLKVAP